jgi:hypothetical protein
LPPLSPEPSVFPSAVKKQNIIIYKTIILPVVLYGCEIWSLTLENRVLRRIFGLKRDEVTRGGENCITRSFVICTLCPSIIRMIKSRRIRYEGM